MTLKTLTARLTYVYCGFLSWPCVMDEYGPKTVNDKNVANRTVIMRFVRIFVGFAAQEATNCRGSAWSC